MTPLDSFDEAEPGFSGHFSANFRAAVTTALQEQGYTVLAWEEDGVNVIGPQADEQYLGLNNLYRRALGLDQAEWPLLIRQFLEHVTHISGGPDLPAALDTVTAQLRPRLVTPFSSDLKPRLWSRPLPGTPLIISLVIDFPHAMAYATQEMVENSQ
ncbi:MAG: hypothetical protein NZ703_02135, partial [Gemmataceae bacterium]|nr:hypothetical protein [Gemmataceae bacterium]